MLLEKLFEQRHAKPFTCHFEEPKATKNPRI